MSDSPSQPSAASDGSARKPRGEFREAARDRLIESRLTPNGISMTGLVLNVAAAVLILEDYFVLGALAFIIGSIMDTLDGRYSRMSGKGTPFGAFLDSTLDRIEEGVVLAAVCWHFAERGDEAVAAACLLVVLGSLMVSYTRARAEALGVECKVGHRDPAGARRDPLDRPPLRRGGADLRRRSAAGGDLRDGRPDGVHRGPARLARAGSADRIGRPGLGISSPGAKPVSG